MSQSSRVRRILGAAALIAGTGVFAFAQAGGPGGQNRGRGTPILPPPTELAAGNAMTNPYGMLENWPHLGTIKPGAAIGIVPDGTGGVWLQHRSVPAILHINSSGDIIKQFEVTFSSSHGLCRDRDGNLWAADSGPFNDAPDAGVRGNQLFKFNPEGKLLLTLGKPGVARASNDTFIQPTGCIETPDGNILVADGHWPRPKNSQQDGDRLVWFTRDGKFIKEFGRHGSKAGEFIGPHGLAF